MNLASLARMSNSNRNSNSSTPTNNAQNAWSIVLGTTLVVGTISSLGWYYYYTQFSTKTTTSRVVTSQQQQQQQQQPDEEDEEDDVRREQRRRSTLSNITTTMNPNIIRPPFPQTLRDMLSKCRLAYLSTVDTQAASSHLSLMRFTYLHDDEDGEIVIMSTNKNTKKFEMLQQQQGVALLVHDFPHGDDVEAAKKAQASSSSTAAQHSSSTITLNGSCRILAGDEETKYRHAHLKHNPEYPQFILGDDIAVLCIHVTSGRICDVHDNVIHWNVYNNNQQQP